MAVIELAARAAQATAAEIRSQAREGKNPYANIVRGVVQQGRRRPIPSRYVALASASGKQQRPAWRTFGDIAALNAALDDEAFIGEWAAAREAGTHLVSVTGTLYPYEPICAGSADMWQKYWTMMQQALRERLGAGATGGKPALRQKVRDWFTHSLFLWGFSMVHDPLAGQPRWLGIGSMDEINAVPILMASEVWNALGTSLFTVPGSAWDVSLTAHLEHRRSAAPPSALSAVFEVLEREYFLVVTSAAQVSHVTRSVYFSAYVWALLETGQGDAYAVWEHANIADPELFHEGVRRLAAKAGELRDSADQLMAALAPEVDAALGRRS
jgi:hypothetical protein